MDKSKEMKKLHKLCLPVLQYLKDTHDPYCSIVINDNGIKFIREEMTMPVDVVND